MPKIDTTCLIDDDPIFLYGIKKMMRLANFCDRFITYKNGQDAINALRSIVKTNKKLPDVILLDINMPILDGWQFLDEFIHIKLPKKIHVYVVSSSKDVREIEKAKAYKQVNNFFIKPISYNDLSHILQEINQPIDYNLN